MRPSLNILEPELITRIVDEAMRVLAEVGMEIRGPEMRRRLLDHGLPLDATGEALALTLPAHARGRRRTQYGPTGTTVRADDLRVSAGGPSVPHRLTLPSRRDDRIRDHAGGDDQRNDQRHAMKVRRRDRPARHPKCGRS